MKIIMVLDNGYDPDVRVYKEAQYLHSKGIYVDILCWDREPESTRPIDENHDGIHIKRFRIPSQYGTGGKQLPAYFRFALNCRKYLAEQEFDYLHCHDLLDGIIGRFFCTKPYVFDMHEYYEDTKPSKDSFIHKLVVSIIRRSHAALYENDVYLDPSYAEIRDKLYPLKNYPDSNIIKQLRKTPSSVFRIGYHGGVRNQVAQFEALAEAVAEMDDVRVDINGCGIDLPQLTELGKKSHNVFVHGPFNGTTQLTELYQNTDVLFCGYDKNDPNMQDTAEIVKYFEAILTGTPMIATESLAVGRRVRKNEFGLAVDTENPSEIQKAICRLKEDHDFLSLCSQNELAVANQYDWNDAVKILDDVYSI